MVYPIASIETKDRLELHGLFLEPEKKTQRIFIFVHGTASNFYEEPFMEKLSRMLLKKGISMLSINTRGTGVYDAYQKSGAATEIFLYCILDLDAWVKFVIDKNYSEVILAGHSLGTEKAVYYMNYGKYKNSVESLILLAPANSYGCRIYSDNYRFSPEDERKTKELIERAENLIKNGRNDAFLDRYSYAGIMPKSAESLVNFLAPEKKINRVLPFYTGKLEIYQKIKVPILAVIGDKKEYTGIPIKDALKLMERDNKNTETHQITNCNHDFDYKEEKLVEIISKFLDKIHV